MVKGFAQLAKGQNFAVYANSNVCKTFTSLDQGNDPRFNKQYLIFTWNISHLGQVLLKSVPATREIII